MAYLYTALLAYSTCCCCLIEMRTISLHIKTERAGLLDTDASPFALTETDLHGSNITCEKLFELKSFVAPR